MEAIHLSRLTSGTRYTDAITCPRASVAIVVDWIQMGSSTNNGWPFLITLAEATSSDDFFVGQVDPGEGGDGGSRRFNVNHQLTAGEDLRVWHVIGSIGGGYNDVTLKYHFVTVK